MGAVHGVYLKYVGLSAVSFVGYHLVVGTIGPMDPLPISTTNRMLLATSSENDSRIIIPLLRLGTASILGYSTILNGAVAVLFKLHRGMSLIGKDRQNGTIPLWSYALFFPFHIPTYAYTYIHTKCGTMKPYANANDPEAKLSKKATKVPVPVASEVQPGWWVGGCYANQLKKRWAGVVDLTVEFPERCRSNTLRYLCLPTWDGVPCSPEQLEKAAIFCIEAREEWNESKKRGLVEGEPQVLIHCAHGRGRSTTVMCAVLVKMGLFANYEEALDKGIRPGRPCCKLNSLMRKNLAEWQSIYIDGKKVC